MISLAAFVIVLFAIVELGSPVARRLALPQAEAGLAAFLIGSLGFGVAAFAFSHLRCFSPAGAWVLIGLGVAGALEGQRFLAALVQKTLFKAGQAWRHTPKTITLPAGLFLLLLILLCLTPPRSGDAMRYHLAQLKDMVRHGGWVFRPYYHYHFPQYFSLIFFPAYALGGGMAMKLAALTTAAVTILATWRLALWAGFRSFWPALLVLSLTPLAFQEATIVANDWAVLCYAMLGVFFAVKGPRYWWLAGMGMGVSLGVKYQAVLLLPWFLFLLWQNGEGGFYRRFLLLIKTGLLLVLIASPFYVRNYIFLSNPIWPLKTELFNISNTHLTEMAARYSGGMSGVRSLSNIPNNCWALLRFPQIPALLWLLAIAGAVWGKRNCLHLGVGLIFFFGFWYLAQPKFYARFAIFALPLAALAITLLWDQVRQMSSSWSQQVLGGVLGLMAIFGVGVFGWYSSGLLAWHVPALRDNYHRATWYYPDYQWINQNLSVDAKILVLARSGHTYYLDRDYLRGDHEMSAEISWHRISNAEQLMVELKKRKITSIALAMSMGQVSENLNIVSFLKKYVADGIGDWVYVNKRTPLCYQRLLDDTTYDEFRVFQLK